MSPQDSEKKPEKVALFDLDGTLADFDGSTEKGMRMIATPEEIARGDFHPREQDSEPEHIRERRRLIKRQSGFWRDLAMLPTGLVWNRGSRAILFSRMPNDRMVARGVITMNRDLEREHFSASPVDEDEEDEDDEDDEDEDKDDEDDEDEDKDDEDDEDEDDEEDDDEDEDDGEDDEEDEDDEGVDDAEDEDDEGVDDED